MTEIKYTLLSDGSSDKRLIPILTWLLHNHCPGKPVHDQWADFSGLPSKHKPKTLTDRIKMSIDSYPCDIFFIHRDAEKESYAYRVQEIRKAIITVSQTLPALPAICVVPVRMQEAWILFDEFAIRTAAGNPNGKIPLTLPVMSKTETLIDPKAKLTELLISASGYTGRHLKKLKSEIHQKAHLVAGFIADFAPLRALPAFVALENDLKSFIIAKGWI